MPGLDDFLDVDLFCSGNPDLRVEDLYRLRRSTHRTIVRFGGAVWAESRCVTGRLSAPPGISDLPASQQPAALAADEAARIAGAHMYGLDEAATAAAVTVGAEVSALIPRKAELGASRLVEAVAVKPPAECGLLRWASGVGYTTDGIPLIACHWGPLPEGTWLTWWADNRIATRTDMIGLGFPLEKASRFLREIGPLTFSDYATTLYTGPPPELPAVDLPPPENIAHGLALTATVQASWALLSVPGAARLITRRPTPVQAAQDRRAGLKPRPATLATNPDTAALTAALRG